MTLTELIKQHEGSVLLPNGRHKLYQDSLGIWTIGYGYNVQANGLEDDIATLLLEREIDRTVTAVNTKWPWVLELTVDRRNVLYDMAYNMGVAGLATFKNFLEHVKAGRYQQARQHMLASKWASQVKGRATHLADLMWKDSDHGTAST